MNSEILAIVRKIQVRENLLAKSLTINTSTIWKKNFQYNQEFWGYMKLLARKLNIDLDSAELAYMMLKSE